MKRTPFYQFHADHGARFVEFAGWEMPIMYSSVIEEHQHVRQAAGLFDVSHMARFKFSGRHARRFLERMLTRRVSDMATGKCRYSLICNEQGGVRDDVLVYRFDHHWLVVANASNREKLVEHIEAIRGDLSFKFEDETEHTAMIALQGPMAMELVSRFSTEIPGLKKYNFVEKNLLILKMIVSRTGYTGEDGIEIILPAKTASMAMKLLLQNKTAAEKVKPAGLGARDTLRMEAGMPLYGHELGEEIDPLSAGLAFAVNLDKDADENGEAFVGQEALKRIAAEGASRKLVGLVLEGKRTPRQGAKVKVGGQEVGEVTSGCMSPTLGVPIAMALLNAGAGTEGGVVGVEVGKSELEGKVVGLPFYKAGEVVSAV